MADPLAEDIAEDLHDALGLSATYTPKGGSAQAGITVRMQGASSRHVMARNGGRKRIEGTAYLRTSVITTQPVRGATILVDDDSSWDGTWTATAEGEPTSGGEWAVPVVREQTNDTMHGAAGWPRPGG